MRCRECGKPVRLVYDDATNSELRRFQLCFTCNFWTGLVLRRNAPEVVRVASIHDPEEIMHYAIHPDANGGMQGFGGREFTVEFNDGRTVKTRNLWCQGSVPERFKSRLPINAKLI